MADSSHEIRIVSAHARDLAGVRGSPLPPKVGRVAAAGACTGGSVLGTTNENPAQQIGVSRSRPQRPTTRTHRSVWQSRFRLVSVDTAPRFTVAGPFPAAQARG